MIEYLFLLVLSSSIQCYYGQESPKVAPFMSIVKPVIGGKTSFTCQSLAGSPPLLITWFKDGQQMNESASTRIRTNEDSSILIMESISSSHSGNYTCKISNRYGHDSYSSELLIEGPPLWVEKPTNIKSEIGRMLTIRCLVSGYPKPRVQLKKLKGLSWIQLTDKDQIIMVNRDSSSGEFQIRSATRDHQGRYGCAASNGIQPDLWTEFDVIIDGPRVHVAPFPLSVKPVIGGKTSFTCQSLSGSSPLQIVWFKDGIELQNPSDIRIRSIEDSSMLIIDSIKSSHSGNYTCKISNRYGSDSHSSELLVEGPPSWVQKPSDLKLKIGQNINVKCSVAGHPLPKVIWKRLTGTSWYSIDSATIQAANFDILNDDLTIRNATRHHNGRYGCFASNGIEPDLWSEFDILIDGNV
ncbi:Down syndrome cell adhesion molecule-like protein Dscam2 [Tetranychus urticae]|uniref:Down syndrome cell adhesion molecule-like protein Dscam2 n=1 Tax=Tetranychus urticae TaxID=32264 RepID=UPI000D642273|nr:Down syndrome cell adhesion molecule-like protein Dscam2 [Tetranychus urticae]